MILQTHSNPNFVPKIGGINLLNYAAIIFLIHCPLSELNVLYGFNRGQHAISNLDPGIGKTNFFFNCAQSPYNHSRDLLFHSWDTDEQRIGHWPLVTTNHYFVKGLSTLFENNFGTIETKLISPIFRDRCKNSGAFVGLRRLAPQFEHPLRNPWLSIII